MKTCLSIILFLFFTILFSDCNKNWWDNPAVLVGRYRMNVTADSSGIPIRTYIDTIIVSLDTTSDNGLIISGNYVYLKSSGGGSVSYTVYPHVSGDLSYTFWNGGENVSFEQSSVPGYGANHWVGSGSKIH